MALITSSQVKKKTTIGGNVDPDKFMPLVDDIEFSVLENVLGTKLYNKIVKDYNNGTPNNLEDDYLVLYNDYIVDILCFLVYADFLRDNIVLGQNSGIYTHTPEDATPANISDVEYKAKRYQSKADIRIERMITFLCEKDLTEYTDSQDNDYDQDPTRDMQTIGGWWLGDVPTKKIIRRSGADGDYLELE